MKQRITATELKAMTMKELAAWVEFNACAINRTMVMSWGHEELFKGYHIRPEYTGYNAGRLIVKAFHFTSRTRKADAQSFAEWLHWAIFGEYPAEETEETAEQIEETESAPQAATEAPEQPTTDEQKEEDNTMSNTANDLQKYVDGIAADLRRLYEANPTDEEREAAEENGEACDLYTYFEDVLDIEYTISSRGDYLGARIAIALGGPNIYIDTREGYVKGYWGTDREEAWIPSEICEEIDSIMEEYYDMVRGA